MGKVWKLPPLPPKPKQVVAKLDFESGSEGAEVSFRVTGLDALEARLLAMPAEYMNAALREMSQIAHEIIEDSKENFVPFETGALKDSGDSDEYQPFAGVETPKLGQISMWFAGETGDGTTSEIDVADIEGNRTTMRLPKKTSILEGVTSRDPRVYALEQHENREYRHEIGGAKYLELPFNLAIPTILPRIHRAIVEATGDESFREAE